MRRLPKQLESQLILTGERGYDFLVNKRNVDNQLYGGREQQFLETLRSQAGDSAIEFKSLVQAAKRNIASRPQMLMSGAVESIENGS